MTCVGVSNLGILWVLSSLAFYFAGIVTAALAVYLWADRRRVDEVDDWARGVEVEMRAAADEWPEPLTPMAVPPRGAVPAPELVEAGPAAAVEAAAEVMGQDLPVQFGTLAEHHRRPVTVVAVDDWPQLPPSLAWGPDRDRKVRRVPTVRSMLAAVWAGVVVAARWLSKMAEPVLLDPSAVRVRPASEVIAQLWQERDGAPPLPQSRRERRREVAAGRPWNVLTGQFTVIAVSEDPRDQEAAYVKALLDLLDPACLQRFVETAQRRETILGLRTDGPLPVATIGADHG